MFGLINLPSPDENDWNKSYTWVTNKVLQEKINILIRHQRCHDKKNIHRLHKSLRSRICFCYFYPDEANEIKSSSIISLLHFSSIQGNQICNSSIFCCREIHLQNSVCTPTCNLEAYTIMGLGRAANQSLVTKDIWIVSTPLLNCTFIFECGCIYGWISSVDGKKFMAFTASASFYLTYICLFRMGMIEINSMHSRQLRYKL